MPRIFSGEPAKASFEVSLSEQSKISAAYKGAECKRIGSVSHLPARNLE